MPKTLPTVDIESAIRVIRGQRVMMDFDLAKFYGVETRRLLEQLRRNKKRFPRDFAFQLDSHEFANLMSQIATSSSHGGRRKLPWAFTEHGAVMLASVLNSKTAIGASVAIVRAFVALQKAARISGADLVAKLSQIDGRLSGHDETLDRVIEALNTLLNPPAKPSKEIGFHTLKEDGTRTDLAKLPRREIRYATPRRARKKTAR
jgi:hypothetical protein